MSVFNRAHAEIYFGLRKTETEDLERRVLRGLGPKIAMSRPEIATKPRENREGAPIASTPAKLAQFWRWFGDSVMVDAAGRPIPFFCATLESESDPTGSSLYKAHGDDGGYCFSTDIGAVRDAYGLAVVRPGKPAIRKVFVKIVNPLMIEGGVSDDGRRWSNRATPEETSAAAKALRGEGYDGVLSFAQGTFFRGHVAEAEQIKSVNNRGRFDPGDPDIFA